MEENSSLEQRKSDLSLRAGRVLSVCGLRGWIESENQSPLESQFRQTMKSVTTKLQSGNAYDLLSVDRDLDIAETQLFTGFPEENLEVAILLGMGN